MSSRTSLQYQPEYLPPGEESGVDLPAVGARNEERVEEWFQRLTDRLLAGEDLRGDPAGWLVDCVRFSDELACRVVSDPGLVRYSRGGWSLAKFAVQASPLAARRLVSDIESLGWPDHPNPLWPLLQSAVRDFEAAEKILARSGLAEWRGPPPHGDNLATQTIRHHGALRRRVLLDEELRDLEGPDGMTLGGFAVRVHGSPLKLSDVLSVGTALKASCRALAHDGGTLREMTIFEALHIHHAGPGGLEGRLLRDFTRELLELEGEDFRAAFGELARLDPPAATGVLCDLVPEQWEALGGQELAPLLSQPDPDNRRQAMEAMKARHAPGHQEVKESSRRDR